MRPRRPRRFLTAAASSLLIAMFVAPESASAAGPGRSPEANRYPRAERPNHADHDRRRHGRFGYGRGYPWGLYRGDQGYDEYEGDLGLRYYRRWYRYRRSDEDRKRYPHSFDGQFGLQPRDDGLTLRHFVHPGLSPFSRSDSIQEPPPAPEPETGTADPDPSDDDYRSGAAMVPPPRQLKPAPRPLPPLSPDFVPSRAASTIDNPAHARAWALLDQRLPELARGEFASAAMLRADWGRPRTGYAVCAGLQGHHRTAVWIMRRALKVDARALEGPAPTDATAEQVRELLELYRDAPEVGLRDIDGLFMRAALSYMLGDTGEARLLLIKAIERGDRHAGTLRLRNVLLGAPDATPRLPDFQNQV